MYRNLPLVLLALVLVAGCSAPRAYQSKLDPLALQQMQTQEFETSKQILFASVVSVFQDTGFIIEAGDLETGMITAKSATQSGQDFFRTTSALTVKASAFVEQSRPGFAKTRLNFVESTESRGYYGGGGVQDVPIENPAYYEKIFGKVREAVFLREANKAHPAASSAPQASVPGAMPATK
jgi:hypothetical protein